MRNRVRMDEMSNVSTLDDSMLWEEAAERARIESVKLREPYERAQREEARLKAEREADQEAIEAKRRIELFVAKSMLHYSEQLAVEICERISCGGLLIDICDEENMPTMRRCNQWLKEHTEFQALYRDSINDRLNIFEEQVLKIADDMKNDFKTIV